MKFVKGVVNSRRLGLSLGINLLPDLICSENCVYCECGVTRDLTLKRKEYVPTEKVIAELDKFLQNRPKADYITFSGYGEPTLHSGIGQIIDHLHADHPHYKIALLTNSTLLHQKEVRAEIQNLDLLVPSLDAGRAETFQKICRPAPGITFAQVIEGLTKISKEFTGKIWLEILLLRGINDQPEEIEAMVKLVEDLNIDRIDLNTLDRPPAEPGYQPVSAERLAEIAQRFPFTTRIFT
ncbi:MAG: radical SAM protein [Bacillota bacterium]